MKYKLLNKIFIFSKGRDTEVVKYIDIVARQNPNISDVDKGRITATENINTLNAA